MPPSSRSAWAADWTPLTHEPTADEMQALFDKLTYADVAKTIDHSLLRPELDLDTVTAGVRLAVRYDVASATVRPADVALAAGGRKPTTPVPRS